MPPLARRTRQKYSPSSSPNRLVSHGPAACVNSRLTSQVAVLRTCGTAQKGKTVQERIFTISDPNGRRSRRHHSANVAEVTIPPQGMDVPIRILLEMFTIDVHAYILEGIHLELTHWLIGLFEKRTSPAPAQRHFIWRARTGCSLPKGAQRNRNEVRSR
jgi:hypothetical protein